VRGNTANRTSPPRGTGAGRDGRMPPFTLRATVIRYAGVTGEARPPAAGFAHVVISISASSAAPAAGASLREPSGRSRPVQVSNISRVHHSHVADA